MMHLSKLSFSDAINYWNNFVFDQKTTVPFSFNPSLFFFFQNHFNWKPYYLLLYKNNEPVALLPIVNTGIAWVSLPHFSYGGILFNNEFKITDRRNLITKLINLVVSEKAGAGFYKIELDKLNVTSRNQNPKLFIRSYDNQKDENFIKSEKITSIIYLRDDKNQMFSALSSNLRRKLRKGDNNNLQIKHGGIELLSDFYTVYSKNIHHLKSLNYSKQFFKDLFAYYQYGIVRFFVVYHNQKPVGSALLASYNSFYENLFFATLPSIRKLYVSDQLHWQMIRFVLKQGKKSPFVSTNNIIYSLGRSTMLSSVHKYKSHWPVTDIPLFIYSDIKDFRQYDMIQKVWKRVPFFITRPLGSKLIKHIY